MLHAPATDSKQQSDSTKGDPPAREHDWQSAFDGSHALGLPPVAGGGWQPADGPYVIGLPLIRGGGLRPPTPRQQKFMRLQRAYGNQAVLRMLELERSQPAIQPKLVVNEPGDAYEQEADRVAEQVMRMPAPDLSTTAAPPRLSRKCAACEEEARNVQAKPAGTPEAAGEAPPIVREVLRSSGQPLDPATRAFFEPRFGYDFGKVQLHTGAKAAQSARAVDALAYTVGNHVVLGETPQSHAPSGNALLAHELTHVIQQGGLAATDRGLPFGTSHQAAGPRVQRQQSDADESCHNCLVDGQLVVCCIPYTAAQAPNADACWNRYCVPDCTSDPAFCSYCKCLGPKWCTCTGIV